MKVTVKLIRNTNYPCPCSAGTLDLCIIETDTLDINENNIKPRVELFICSMCGKQFRINDHHTTGKYAFPPENNTETVH